MENNQQSSTKQLFRCLDWFRLVRQGGGGGGWRSPTCIDGWWITMDFEWWMIVDSWWWWIVVDAGWWWRPATAIDGWWWNMADFYGWWMIVNDAGWWWMMVAPSNRYWWICINSCLCSLQCTFARYPLQNTKWSRYQIHQPRYQMRQGPMTAPLHCTPYCTVLKWKKRPDSDRFALKHCTHWSAGNWAGFADKRKKENKLPTYRLRSEENIRRPHWRDQKCDVHTSRTCVKSKRTSAT